MSRTTSQRRPSQGKKTTARKPAARGGAQAASSRSPVKKSPAPAVRGRGVPAASRKPAARRRKRAPMPSWVVPVSVGVALMFCVWQFYPVLKMQYQEQRRVAKLERQLETMRARNKRLRADVERLKTPEGVEEVARESLGYVRPGENAYVVTEMGGSDEPSLPDVAEDDSRDASGTPVWVAVLDFVFDVDEP